jgi:hypothetical protein
MGTSETQPRHLRARGFSQYQPHFHSQSGRSQTWTMAAIGTRRTFVSAVEMSAFGVKRTSLETVAMSANDPKRTSLETVAMSANDPKRTSATPSGLLVFVDNMTSFSPRGWHEAARFHWSTWRRSGSMAGRKPRAAVGRTSDRVFERALTRRYGAGARGIS